MSEPKISFFGEFPITVSPLEPNDDDRTLIQQLVKQQWEIRGPEARSYPIADIVTDAYHETLKLIKKKYGL